LVRVSTYIPIFPIETVTYDDVLEKSEDRVIINRFIANSPIIAISY
jgi:hypothetical protein